MTQALVLIDLQADYFPGGAMELHQPDAAVQQAAVLLQRFRDRSLPIFHVQHIAQEPDATFFLPGTPGAEIHPSVRPSGAERLVVKHHANSFRDTTLLDDLRLAGVSSIVFAGMMTYMCVDTTVRAAADMGFDCTLAKDACATCDLEFDGQKVPAPLAQAAYFAGLNDGFAKVRSVSDIA
jgi:nicotinamidase-related amidase